MLLIHDQLPEEPWSDDLGRIAPGFIADIIAVEGEPLREIDAVVTGVRWVMKDGAVLVDAREAGR